MNFFAKLMLALVKAAPVAAPIFIHSDRGILIFNASEALAAGVAEQFEATATAAVPAKQ